MGDTKIFSLPDSNGFGGGNMEGLLVGSLMNGGGGFGGNMNNPFWALVLLAFLRNGFFGGNGFGGENNAQLSAIQDQLSTQHGQTLLMDAIKGSSSAVHELATTIGCNHNTLTAAINGVQAAISNVANQVGMNSMQVINAIQAGNTAIANQIAQCCCDNKLLVQQQGYENRINNIEQSNMITKGFGDVQYATQAQTSALAANQDSNTRAILAKLDQIEDSRKDREIASLTAALTAATSRAERAAELAPITKALADIQCKQPNTLTIPYSPVTAIPNCVAWNVGLSALAGGYPYANGGVFG